MTPEQKQRVEQIRKKREQQRNRPMLAVEGVAWDDVDFLLSIVKEQEGDDYIRGAYESICGPVRDAAATFMRSACVEKVRRLAAAHRAHAEKHKGNGLGELQAVRAEECDIVAKMLESLSIEKSSP